MLLFEELDRMDRTDCKALEPSLSVGRVVVTDHKRRSGERPPAGGTPELFLTAEIITCGHFCGGVSKRLNSLLLCLLLCAVASRSEDFTISD